MKTTSRIKTIMALTVLALLATGGCRSGKTSVATTQPSEVVSMDNDWTTVYSSVNVDLKKPMSMSFSGKMTMSNGKYIHVSMRFFGWEAAVLYIDMDSIYFVDKYHKYLFGEPLRDVLGQKYGNMTVTDIQQVMFGQKKIEKSETIDIDATQFVKCVAGSVASVLSVECQTAQGTVEADAAWNPGTAKWNETDRSVNFKVPSNYQRITLDNLKTALKTMAF